MSGGSADRPGHTAEPAVARVVAPGRAPDRRVDGSGGGHGLITRCGAAPRGVDGATLTRSATAGPPSPVRRRGPGVRVYSWSRGLIGPHPTEGRLVVEAGVREGGSHDFEIGQTVLAESALAGESQVIGTVDERPGAIRGVGIEAHDGGGDGVGADRVTSRDEESGPGGGRPGNRSTNLRPIGWC